MIFFYEFFLSKNQISDNNGIQMTFDEIQLKTIRAAQNLQARGFQPQQVFLMFAGNFHHIAPVTIATFAIGCPMCCLDPLFEKEDVIRMLEISKPVLMFCDVKLYDLLEECAKLVGNDAHVFTFGGSKGRSEPIENLFKETHMEDEFM